MFRPNVNLCPTIKCPHCGKYVHPQLSGYARSGWNTRTKTCHFCKMDYTVHICIMASKDDDFEMAGVKNKMLRQSLKDFISIFRKNLTNLKTTFIETKQTEQQLIGGNTEYPSKN